MKKLTLALGLRSTAQSLSVIGRELGLFAKHGLDLQIVREETAGPAGVRGLLNGDFELAEIGAVPLVQAALEGGDPLILLAAERVSALYIVARGHLSAQALRGGQIAVLSEAGQTGHSAKAMLQRWGLENDVRLLALHTYPAIFAALRDGEIQAGVLTADYRIVGELAHGFTVLADLGLEFGYQAPVLATTRKQRDRDPQKLADAVAAYVESIRHFKEDSARVVPILCRHLGFVDYAQAASIRSFYAARFQDKPLASMDGIARIIASFSKQHPAALKLKPHDVYDPAYVEALEQPTPT